MGSWVKPNGEALESPVIAMKSRGRQLSLESALRLRDLLVTLLVVDLGLSVPDARRVLMLGSITEDHIRRRVKATPANVKTLIADLRQEMLDGSEIGVG
jgi:hypothetical protein